jgi:hypothetical protein
MVLITCDSDSLEVAETAQLTGDDIGSWPTNRKASGSQVLDYDCTAAFSIIGLLNLKN